MSPFTKRLFYARTKSSSCIISFNPHASRVQDEFKNLLRSCMKARSESGDRFGCHSIPTWITVDKTPLSTAHLFICLVYALKGPKTYATTLGPSHVSLV